MEIKICCISSHDEAGLALDAGADILGLVSAMPSGPGVIDEELIASIAASVSAQTFLLTSLCEPEAIIAQHGRCGTTAIQLCDALPPGSYARLREALPKIRLVQVVHVTGEESYDEAMAAARDVDALLLDSGNPRTRQGSGGTDASRLSISPASAGIRRARLSRGRLRPENVAEALASPRKRSRHLQRVRTDGLSIG